MDNAVTPTTRQIITDTLRRLLDRRVLASTVNLFYQPALAHKKNAVPVGSQVYNYLYREALAYALAHVEVWGVSLAELHARIPALEHLRFLAASAETLDHRESAPVTQTGSCNSEDL